MNRVDAVAGRAGESESDPVSSTPVDQDTPVARSTGGEPNRHGVPVGAPYKDALDDRFNALKAAIDATDTGYRKRPVAQLLGHLRWRRPNQTVHWNGGTTPSVPETAAGLSIDVGTPLPDAMEIVLAALRNELSGEALDSLEVYHQAVHDLNAECGVVPQASSAGLDAGAHRSGPVRRGGTAYVAPTRTGEAPEVESAIFLRNPDLIDRGTTAHMHIQDTLAAHIRTEGMEPVSPDQDDQQFDVAWVAQGALYICEVKSLTDDNEESQLRLGLGQLLSYLYRTKVEHWADVDEVLGVLAVERPPSRPDWVGICAESGVTLTWPDRFPELFEG